MNSTSTSILPSSGVCSVSESTISATAWRIDFLSVILGWSVSAMEALLQSHQLVGLRTSTLVHLGRSLSGKVIQLLWFALDQITEWWLFRV